MERERPEDELGSQVERVLSQELLTYSVASSGIWYSAVLLEVVRPVGFMSMDMLHHTLDDPRAVNMRAANLYARSLNLSLSRARVFCTIDRLDRPELQHHATPPALPPKTVVCALFEESSLK